MTADDEKVAAEREVLKAQIERHIEEEETDLFEYARRELGR